MLQHLTISHYALIEHLDIDWHTGFSVITGETGAGKSIMLGALGLLLGGRADAKAIQMGEKKCMVEATFSIENDHLQPFFANNDIDYDDKECIIRREVLNTGKSRAFINDTPVSATKLKEIGAALIDIHSQHQNLLLRNEHFLIDMLDIIAAEPAIKSAYEQAYAAHKQAATALKNLQERVSKGQADQEYLQFQLSQIDEASLTPNEQNDLEQELQMLSHAEDIKQGLYTAQSLIATDELSVTQNLRQAAEALYNIANNYPQASTIAERIDSARIELDDIEAELSTWAENIDYDPARLAYVEDRISTIYQLEQKHHVSSLDELLAFADDLRSQLNSMENADDDLRRQTETVNRLLNERNQAAQFLTESRQKAALSTEKELCQALHALGMPHAALKFVLTPRTEPDATGADRVVLLFSANKNVPPQDVSQIASGGEIARLMLALKALIARHTQLPTIIFDEIDTGVSGNMAERMATVMQQIAETCQVICITHLPQIAALGTHHYKVFKEDSASATHSHITALSQEERVEEIAHMLSGTHLTDAAINNAKALLHL